MKPQAILIGLAAGLTAALLFTGLVLQSTTAIGLALLAPMPIYIASLGWGSYSGFLAAASAGLAVALGFGSTESGLTLLVTMAGPAAYAGHLAGLARPVDGTSSIGAPAALPADKKPPVPAMEWFPLGKILFSIAVAAASACLFVGWLVGYDPETLAPLVSQALISQGGSDVDPATSAQIQELSRLVIDLVPLVQPALLVVVLVATLQLAAAVTRMSSRLPRPKDDVAIATKLPKPALAIFALAIMGSFLPGSAGAIATVVAGAFGAAFTLVGLASLHRRTRGRAARGVLLFSAYAAMLILSFPIVAFTALGVFETTRVEGPPKAT